MSQETNLPYQSAITVTLESNDQDLVELLYYLSKFSPLRQVQLLNLAKDWTGLLSSGGIIGAKASRVDLSPARTDQSLPVNTEWRSEYP